uniref:rhomboid family intramembrane serine protease n=2 Tax=Flavobacterium sp. TaxID=239 RepID=UPI00404B04D0
MSVNVFIIIVIAVNVLVSWQAFKDMSFFRKYEFHIGNILNGQQYRMVSSAFLHVDSMHLFFNMFTLYFFAPVVVAYLGSFSFLLFYIVSLLAGNVLTLLLHKNDYSYRAVGASGAVTGILYAAILLQPERNLNLMFIPIGIPGYVFGFGYLLYSIYGMKAKNDNIGHTAHFGGAIGGYCMTLIQKPTLFTEEPFFVIVLAIPIIILFILLKSGKI